MTLKALQAKWRAGRNDVDPFVNLISAQFADSLTPFILQQEALIAALAACEKEMRGCELWIKSDIWQKAFMAAQEQARSRLKEMEQEDI